jgi:hypothetical protein
MATTTKGFDTITSTASEEAMNKLSCFHSGIEDLVYNLAEDKAKRRNPPRSGPIQIEAEDVTWAAGRVFEAIERMAGHGDVPAEFADAVHSMRECCGE